MAAVSTPAQRGCSTAALRSRAEKSQPPSRSFMSISDRLTPTSSFTATDLDFLPQNPQQKQANALAVATAFRINVGGLFLFLA